MHFVFYLGFEYPLTNKLVTYKIKQWYEKLQIKIIKYLTNFYGIHKLTVNNCKWISRHIYFFENQGKSFVLL